MNVKLMVNIELDGEIISFQQFVEQYHILREIWTRLVANIDVWQMLLKDIEASEGDSDEREEAILHLKEVNRVLVSIMGEETYERFTQVHKSSFA